MITNLIDTDINGKLIPNAELYTIKPFSEFTNSDRLHPDHIKHISYIYWVGVIGSPYLANVSEMMFGYVFPEAVYESTIHYDFIWYGKKVDIKCKKCAFKPYQNFYASVLESQFNRQKNEVYVFVRVKDDFTKCWILGAYKKEDYKRDAILSLKGKKNSATGYVTKENSLDLPISKLTKLGKYIKE